MDRPERTYWSAEECRWETLPPREVIEAGDLELAAVPAQRDDQPAMEPAKEPVEA
jgi:hypothetical protein